MSQSYTTVHPNGRPQVYEARPIKRQRRTNAEIEGIKAAMIEIVAADNPMTLRGLYYRLVAAGIVAKTDAEYEKVGHYLGQLRREKRIPYAHIADNTRLQRKPQSYTGLTDALRRTAQTYRRALWAEANVYLEVWVEKDALGGILFEETSAYDVPLMVARGYSSTTFLRSAAEAMASAGRPAYIYLLTDHDPAGMDIAAAIEKGIRWHLNDLGEAIPMVADRLAVTPEQIRDWNLPTRPTKTTDRRAKRFGAVSVDLDAIPPRLLRGLVREAIERHIDDDELASLQLVEEQEQLMLYHILDQVAGWDV